MTDTDTMKVFLVIANAINVVYNVPQMVQTYKTGSAGDINEWFIGLRIVGNSIWAVYGAFIGSTLLLTNSCVTIIASFFLAYYKVRERTKTTEKAQT